MNHLLKILFLVPLFVSCTSSQEDVPIKEEEQVSIGFTAKVQGSRTEATIEDLKVHGFSVWGGYKDTNVFNGTKITKTDDGWGYDNPQFWTYNTYNFYAVYPDNTHNAYSAEEVTVSNTTKQLTIKDFNSALGYDLMYAESLNNDGSNPPDEVSFTFKHTMTQLAVSLKKNSINLNDEIKVTGLYVYGMYGKGDYELTASTEAWTNLKEVSYYGKEITPVTLGVASYTPCVSGIMVIPQSFEDMDINLLITYSYKSKDANEASNQYLSVPIPTSEPWEIRKKITYQGEIDVDDKIVFSTPIVETWGAEQVGGTIIIK